MLKILIPLAINIAFHLPAYPQAESNFVGKWKFDLTATIAEMRPEIKIQYDSLPAEIKSRAAVSMNGRAFTFVGDSVHIDWTSRGQTKQSKGTWSFNSSTTELIITVGVDEQRFAVALQENGDMVWENNRPFGFFYRMCLRKEQ